jgi:DNA-binding NarL/FixJ family response regulator
VAAHVRLYREGVIAALSRENVDAQGLDPHLVAGTASRLASAFLVDMTAPRASETVQNLQHLAAARPVIAFAVRETDVASCLVAGVSTCVMFDSPMEALIAATRSALKGDPGMMRAPRTVASSPDGRRTLTPREQEVLALMLVGPSNRHIAESLHISEATVKHHVHSILGKEHVASRAQLVARLAPPRRIQAG